MIGIQPTVFFRLTTQDCSLNAKDDDKPLDFAVPSPMYEAKRIVRLDGVRPANKSSS